MTIIHLQLYSILQANQITPPQQFQIWRKNLSGFRKNGHQQVIAGSKSPNSQDYVKNLTGLALNLELLTPPPEAQAQPCQSILSRLYF